MTTGRQDNSDLPGNRPVGDLIRAGRETRGWSQNELARRSQIDVAVVHRIESGAIAEPSRAKLMKLAEVLELDLAELYRRTSMPDAAQVLPSFQPYLRAKYSYLPPEAQERLATHFARVEAEYGQSGSGPDNGEDE